MGGAQSGAAGYFTLALLIVVLMPAVILPWEGRKAPDGLFVAIAACGLASSGIHGGLAGLGWAVAGALACLVVVGGAVTILRANTRLRILTGGQIKLMAAGATWLGLPGAAIMILITIFSLFSIAALQQVSESQRRPDSAAIVAVAILCVAIPQQLSGL